MLAALTLAFLHPAPAPAVQDAAPRAARVSAARTQVRAFFDARSPVVAELQQGHPLLVLEVKTPWAKVQAPGGFDAWIHKDFVTWSGADGTVTSRNVNLRPLPSTDASSTPLGRLDKGDAVLRLGREGDWFRVRAPERFTAWAPLAELEILPHEPASWSEDWKKAATARAPVPEVPPAPQPEAARVETPPAPAPSTRPQTPSAEAKPASAPAGAATPSGGTASTASGQRAFPAAQIAKDPSRWLALAHQDLAAFRATLAGAYDGWSDARAAELEAAFTLVLWHGSLAADLDGARRGLSGLDALRRSYADWLEDQRRRQEEAKQSLSVEVYQRKLAALDLTWGDDGAGGAMVTGWLEKSGKGPRPYAIARGGRTASVHDFLGRWGDLSEYAGRELVVRGTWREDADAPGGRVLSITELRVLPEAGR